jgi:tRNA (guanine37-N1)-methyltransferase
MKLIFDKKLKGIKELDKSLFKVNVELPGIKIKKNDYSNAKRLLKPYLFESLISTKRIIDANSSESYKYILLDPETFSFDSLDDSAKKELAKYIASDSNDVNEEKITKYVDQLPVELNYDDFKYEEVIKAIIPDELLNDHVGAKSYSIIGHIAHFNLRDKILDYKNLIGKIQKNSFLFKMVQFKPFFS